jgi:hypothetical protein
MLYSHSVGVRLESISLFACCRSSQWFAFMLYIHTLHTRTHSYIHTYNKLFMHADLNNSELISTRGVILEEHTVQINITRWYNIQKQRKKNYYLLYRQQDEPIFRVCLINSSFKLKEQKDSATFTSYGKLFHRPTTAPLYLKSFTKIGIRFRKGQIGFSISKIIGIIHSLFNRKDVLRFGTSIYPDIHRMSSFFTMIRITVIFLVRAVSHWFVIRISFVLRNDSINVIFALITSVSHCFVIRMSSSSQLFASNVIFALRRFRIDLLFAVRRLIRRYSHSHLFSHWFVIPFVIRIPSFWFVIGICYSHWFIE